MPPELVFPTNEQRSGSSKSKRVDGDNDEERLAGRDSQERLLVGKKTTREEKMGIPVSSPPPRSRRIVADQANCARSASPHLPSSTTQKSLDNLILTTTTTSIQTSHSSRSRSPPSSVLHKFVNSILTDQSQSHPLPSTQELGPLNNGYLPSSEWKMTNPTTTAST